MSCIGIVLSAILSLNPSWTEAKAKKYAVPICSESIAAEIDPLIVVSVIHHESGWSTRGVMHNGTKSKDFGIMQFNCQNDIDKIYLKWRKWWCQPKRRKYLKSIDGGIKAGVRELVFWKKICLSRHTSNELKLYNSEVLVLDYFNHPCPDCRASSLDSYNYVNSQSENNLKNVLKHHWWIQHYNFNSKHYSKRIMYIYFALHQNREDIYTIVRARHYTRFKNLEKCLQDKDLCLKEYREWQRKKKLKRQRRRK